jgi:hypothetical protein
MQETGLGPSRLGGRWEQIQVTSLQGLDFLQECSTGESSALHCVQQGNQGQPRQGRARYKVACRMGVLCGHLWTCICPLSSSWSCVWGDQGVPAPRVTKLLHLPCDQHLCTVWAQPITQCADLSFSTGHCSQ